MPVPSLQQVVLVSDIDRFISRDVCWDRSGGRFGDGMPVGVRFSAPIRTGPEAHASSSVMGTGSFSGVKRPGHGVNHPPPHLAPRLKK